MGGLEHQPHDLDLEDGVWGGVVLHALTVTALSPRRTAGEETLSPESSVSFDPALQRALESVLSNASGDAAPLHLSPSKDPHSRLHSDPPY